MLDGCTVGCVLKSTNSRGRRQGISVCWTIGERPCTGRLSLVTFCTIEFVAAAVSLCCHYFFDDDLDPETEGRRRGEAGLYLETASSEKRTRLLQMIMLMSIVQDSLYRRDYNDGQNLSQMMLNFAGFVMSFNEIAL